MPDVPHFAAQQNGVLCSNFLGIGPFGIGFSDVGAVERTREWSPKTVRPGRRARLSGLDIVGALPAAAI